MDRPEQLTALQIDLASIFFDLDVSKDFLVAGGAALLASDLIARPTEDLDLFAATPTTTVTQAKDAFVKALQGRHCDVVIVQDGPTFCRMIVTRVRDETLVDLAIDSPPQSTPTISVLAQMMGTLSRFDDHEIPLGVDAVPLVREFFRNWAAELP